MSRHGTVPVVDAVLIGAGVMSATLGTMLRALNPDWRIEVYERLDQAAAESSDAWNNAGTGHSAFCELNYTPRQPDGTIDVSKAIQICEQFELSKQFWAYLTETGSLPDPSAFIRKIPHMSFVWGQDNVDFLRQRHSLLTQSPLFQEMRYTEDRQQIADWLPLVMQSRDTAAPVAATRVDFGNDVNFGALTRALIVGLDATPGGQVFLNHEVTHLRQKDGLWCVWVVDNNTGEERLVWTRFVFIGAGGGTLSLLEKSGLPESKGYGGFPVSGQWLRCINTSVIGQHHAKVYGKAALGAPPMSVPHLDTRFIDGQKQLLFGPYAGFTTKFLKRGSITDLFRSIGWDNIVPVVSAGLQNVDLTQYLVGQALLPHEQRMAFLREYYPEARSEDWELEIAGLRVQIIKSNGRGGGELKFGTEVVSGAQGTLAALLGASPGASTAAAIMLDVLQRCFPDQMQSDSWRRRLRQMFPSLGESLHQHPTRCAAIRASSLRRLNL